MQSIGKGGASGPRGRETDPRKEQNGLLLKEKKITNRNILEKKDAWTRGGDGAEKVYLPPTKHLEKHGRMLKRG